MILIQIQIIANKMLYQNIYSRKINFKLFLNGKKERVVTIFEQFLLLTVRRCSAQPLDSSILQNGIVEIGRRPTTPLGLNRTSVTVKFNGKLSMLFTFVFPTCFQYRRLPDSLHEIF